MDIKQDKSDSNKSGVPKKQSLFGSTEKKKPEVQLPDVKLPKFYMPKIKPKEWPNKIKLKLKEYKRVLKITRKPTTPEFKAIVKASGIGIIVIGAVGFIIHMIVQLLHIL